MCRFARSEASGRGVDAIASFIDRLKTESVTRRRRAAAAGGGLAAFLAAAGAAAAEDLGIETPGDGAAFGDYPIASSAADLLAVANSCATRNERVDGGEHPGHVSPGHAATSWLSGGDFASRLESRFESHLSGQDAHQHGKDASVATSGDHAAHALHVETNSVPVTSAHSGHSDGAAHVASAVSHAHSDSTELGDSFAAMLDHAAHAAIAAQASDTPAGAFGMSSDHQLDGAAMISRVLDARMLTVEAGNATLADIDDAVTALVDDGEAAAPSASPIGVEAYGDIAFAETPPADLLVLSAAEI